MKITSRQLRKQADDQHRIRQNQRPVSSEEARQQYVRLEKGSVSVGQRINATESVITDPEINSGQPALRDSHVGVGALFDRFMAGDSVSAMAADYGIPASEIEIAIRYGCRWLDLEPGV